jgi:C4-dicarboxylate transporter DctM subunit
MVSGEHDLTLAAGESPSPPPIPHGHQPGQPDLHLPKAVTTSVKVLLEVLFWARLAVLVGTVVFVLVEVFARYALNQSIGSTENILIVLFMWMIFLTLPVAVWSDSSPRVSVFRGGSDGRVQELRRDVVVGIEGAYFVTIILSFISGWQSQTVIQLQPIGWDQLVATLPILIGCAIGLLLLVVRRLGQPIGIFNVVAVLAGAALVVIAFEAFGGNTVAGVVVLLLLAGLGAPIAVALGTGAIVMIGITGTGALQVPAAQLLTGASNVALLALPLFMLMGGLISETRLSRGLGRFIISLVSWLPGGMGVADVLASGIFANMTGNSTADTAAMGTIFIPQMVDQGGYTPEEAASVQSAAGSIGVVFPPAITMIIFATVASANVVNVFIATIIPAALLMVVMASVVMWKKRRTPRMHRTPQLRESLKSLPSAAPVLVIPIILDVGIFSGVFSPFESGAVAVLVVALYLAISRRASPRELRAAADQAFHGMILSMFILVNVSILNYGLVTSGASADISSFVSSVGTSKLLVLLVINLVFLLIHTMVDVIASILVFVPLVLPTALAAHISVYQLAAIIGINSTIGVILPPLGIGLYVASGVARVDPSRVVRQLWPYVISSLLVLVLVSAIPSLSLAL